MIGPAQVADRDSHYLLRAIARLITLRDQARGDEANEIDRELNAVRRAHRSLRRTYPIGGKP